MAELQRRLAQFRSLARLRDLQRAQAATQLAERNTTLTHAIEACQQAQALYQQALDVVRRNRHSGTRIDPLLYGHQLEATDAMKRMLLMKVAVRDEASRLQQEALSAFVDQHSKHRVVTKAVNGARGELHEQQQQLHALEAQDQAGRHAYMDWKR